MPRAPRAPPSAALAILAVFACTHETPRAPCDRDGDCADGEVCYDDGRCLPPAIARRLGRPPADECAVRGGVERGCPDGRVCRMGRCTGEAGCEDPARPRFEGAASARADGPGALLVRWDAAQDDTTPPGHITYRVYASEASGQQDLSAHAVSVQGELEARISGLAPGARRHVIVRAEDEDGLADCNEVEVAGTAGAGETCVEWEADVAPLLHHRCAGCHGGADPAAGLSLESLEGALAGGVSAASGHPAVVACRPDDSLLLRKVAEEAPPVGERMPLRGAPLPDAELTALRRWIEGGARRRCEDPHPCADVEPPLFAGARSVTASAPATATVCWDPASDDVTSPGAIVYDVVLAGDGAPGEPVATSAPGATCATVPALPPGERACLVVRARDAAGNRDAGSEARCVDVPPLEPGCVDHATVVQPILDRHCTRCHSGASAPQDLLLDGYAHLLEGSVSRDTVKACDPARSTLITEIGETPRRGERMPRGGPPLAASQIAALRQWVENGAQPSCALADVCADTTPPAFAGVTAARALSPTALEVCWEPAEGEVGPVRHEIHESASPGSGVPSSPHHARVGATCAEVRVAPGTTLCFVVRARDLRGNADANEVELCATTPAVEGCAIDLAGVEPLLAARCLHCHEGPDPARGLDLSRHGTILAGGVLGGAVTACSWERSLLRAKLSGAHCGRRMPAGGPYLPPSSMSLLAAWVGSGARASCADPDPCEDGEPPVFAGLRGATVRAADEVELCWDPAGDASPVSYEVWEAAAPGQQPFDAPPHHTAPPGTECLRVAVAPAATTCFVVRARDAAGNRDGNGVEACLTTPGACVDWEDGASPVFQARCVHCHQGLNRIRWDTFANAMASGLVVPCDAAASPLVDAVDACRMPRDTAPASCATPACLPPSQRSLLRAWVEQGAPETCGAEGCP